MQTRSIVKTVVGQPAIDGAGVRLVRVLGHSDVYDFDPFLMLDSFDSQNPADYIRGFPFHPHRGIETITYLAEGRIDHKDSLGNSDSILSGHAQWMTAGSGIMHEEMPKPAPLMLGLQLWLNLPKSEKMTTPKYLAITSEMTPVVEADGVTVKVISGSYGGKIGVSPPHITASIYEVNLEAGKSITLPTAQGETVFIFLMRGEAVIDNKNIPQKTAVLFGEGSAIEVSAHKNAPLKFIFFSAPPLREPIAWGGPIVMNTKAELNHAFDELRKGTFIK
ncbi:MAG: pirin family protein [Clostridia bacterium]